MHAIGRDSSGRVVVVINPDEPDPDLWDAVIVDVHEKSVGPMGSAQSVFESQAWQGVDPTFAARAIELVREAIATGSLAKEKSDAPLTVEAMKAIWPGLQISSGSGRAFTIIGASKRKPGRVGQGD
jgi:hypothetical protein